MWMLWKKKKSKLFLSKWQDSPEYSSMGENQVKYNIQALGAYKEVDRLRMCSVHTKYYQHSNKTKQKRVTRNQINRLGGCSFFRLSHFRQIYLSFSFQCMYNVHTLQMLLSVHYDLPLLPLYTHIHIYKHISSSFHFKLTISVEFFLYSSWKINNSSSLLPWTHFYKSNP